MYLNGHPSQRLPGHLNLCFAGIDADMLISALSQVAISSGSACTSASVEPSHVLTAMGLSREHALSSVRLSLGRHTTEQQVETVAAHIESVVTSLRSR